ncbi:MAG: hypothetical protein KatS3mg110_2622 [Pirellulaceae bacterium]|nr:MAG: hypothetical protein KatS3mg110_2622 [Pirellulaceae bacterium]
MIRKQPSALGRWWVMVAPAGWPWLAALLSGLASIVALSVWLARMPADAAAAGGLLAAGLLGGLAAGICGLIGWRRWGRRWLRRWRLERRLVRRERRRLQANRRLLQQSAEELAAQLTVRESQLINRLTTFHEWMEFPQPIALAEEHAETPQLAEKDRELAKLLKRESEILFQKILENAYLDNNRLQWARIRDDALALIRNVARLYRPDVAEPLLETSAEQILRSASRVSLQLLIVLDRLPVDVKQYNLNRLYGYVRSAVKAYGVYKAAEPYLPYANTAYYLGRAAMGANPWMLGAWWIVGQQGKRWVRRWTSKFLERQALALLRDLVHVIGYEAAAVYGGDFFHRDANWIYGTELVELIRTIRLAPESFVAALNELGRLPLRSEYDRVFLYRAMAARQSADPERYRAREVLLPEERQAIARRLENFARAFWLHGQTAQWTRWAQGVEQRLGVRLGLPESSRLTAEEERLEAVRSLASYLLDYKQCEPSDVESRLSGTRCWQRLTDEQRQAIRQELQQNPPFIFSLPSLDTQGAQAEAYWADLVDLAVNVPPVLLEWDELLAEVAAYLHREAAAVKRQFQQACRQRLQQIAAPDALRCDPPPDVVRAVLELVEDDPRVECLLEVSRRSPSSGSTALSLSFSGGGCWLLGTRNRLVAFAVTATGARLLWFAESPIVLRRQESWLGHSYRVEGGQWVDPADQESVFVVSVPFWKSSAEYLAPLLRSALVTMPDRPSEERSL